MRALLSYPFQNLSGAISKVPGIVGFQWRGIQCFRAYKVPRNPQSTDQVLIRNLLTQASQGYQAISLIQKAAWEAYAALTPVTWESKSIIIPAISAYVRVNSYRLIDGQAVTPTAPSTLCDFVASNIATVAYNSGTTVLSFTLTHNCVVTAGKFWVISITGTLPSVGYAAKDNDYRLCKGVTADSIIPVAASPTAVTITAPKFGNWTDADLMGIRVFGLSTTYDPGTPYEEVNPVTVT